MTLLSSRQNQRRSGYGSRRGHLWALLFSGIFATVAILTVGYLLRPTWGPDTPSDPAQMPVSVGGTLFNVPTSAIRMKIQRHSGPQERVDLSFLYSSLAPPEGPKHISASTVEDAIQPIDRIFLSISAHHDALAPGVRARTIYPHYLDRASQPDRDGLSARAFRDGTPYSHEDLFYSDAPNMVARCTRDGDTPGMCLSERRIEGADLTFRFPRSWLEQWRDVASAMDRLTSQVHSPHG